MNLETVLKDTIPYNENSYKEFAEVMKNSYTCLSFWGTRRVYAVGYSGSISLENLCLKIEDLINANPEFSKEDRTFGNSIQEELTKLYKRSKHQVKNSNYLTLFFMDSVYLFNPSHANFFYDGVEDYMFFNFWTEKQCNEITGKNPSGYYAGTFGIGASQVRIWKISDKDKV